MDQINNNQTDDYSFVNSVARIATYDDLSSAPRITEIEPAPTDQYIMNIASKTYELSKMMGGQIPFTIIKEVSENFIHARFTEVIVSILDNGNTIRFADQGPGIEDKEKVQIPGYTSANENMKKYIRGVGSGLPIVEDYFNNRKGSVTIDDNVFQGAVITISLKITEDSAPDNSMPQIPQNQYQYQTPQNERYVQQDPYTGMVQNIAAQQPYQQYQYQQQTNQAYAPQPTPAQSNGMYQQSFHQQYPNNAHNPYGNNFYPSNVRMVGNNNRVPMYVPQVSAVSERGKLCLTTLLSEGALGVTEIAALTDIPPSSTFNELKKLEEAGLIEKSAGQKRILTEVGYNVASSIQ